MTSRNRPNLARQLTDRFGGRWRAIRNDMGMGWYWQDEVSGRTVRSYGEPFLGYDGYSDTEFVTVYIDDQGVTVGRFGLIYGVGL